MIKKYKIEDICKIQSSKRIYLSEYKTSGIPFYRGKEVNELSSGNEISNELFISKDRYEEIKNKYGVPKKGDILITAVGTIGNCWIVDDRKFYFKDGNIIWISSINKDILNKYIYYLLKSSDMQEKLKKISIGTSQQALTIIEIKKLDINIPELSEQKKICNILSAIDKKITLNNQINNNLLEACINLFDNNILKNQNIKYVKIKDLNLDVSDGNYSSKYPTKEEFVKNGVPFIRGTDFIGTTIARNGLYYITLEKHKQLKKGHLKKGDILITTRGNGIGKIAFVPDIYVDANINAQLIRINGNNNIPNSYLRIAFINKKVLQEIKAGITGSAQPQLTVSKFLDIKIPILRFRKDKRYIITKVNEWRN